MAGRTKKCAERSGLVDPVLRPSNTLSQPSVTEKRVEFKLISSPGAGSRVSFTGRAGPKGLSDSETGLRPPCLAPTLPDGVFDRCSVRRDSLRNWAWIARRPAGTATSSPLISNRAGRLSSSPACGLMTSQTTPTAEAIKTIAAVTIVHACLVPRPSALSVSCSIRVSPFTRAHLKRSLRVKPLTATETRL